ncbi:DUF1566 domain-containing protein, partial [Vibrio lentus]|nr:DUF1566 domain-containing protein [Vibrio lentus]
TTKLTIYDFQVSVAQSRTDAESLEFITKVKAYKEKAAKLQQNSNGLNALVEGAKFAQKMAFIQKNSVMLTDATSAIGSASLASELHQASLDLYNAISVLESQYAQVTDFITQLNTATNGIGSEFDSLITLYQTLIKEMSTTATLHDLAQSKVLAKDGLKQAADNGFSVSQANAMVSNRFAKLDELGNYLPSDTTYQQGWRCVEDTKITGKRRVWALLKDGLPHGADDLAYDASATGYASILGSNELLASTNNNRLCGFSDWEVPHLAQLLSINTKAVEGSNSKMTLDTDVFPNYLGLKPEYDKSYFDDGTTFYYWSSAASGDQQYITSYDTKESSQTLAKARTDGSEDKVVLARLFREKSANYQYLNAQGTVVTNRQNAVCAQDTDSNLVWQLFSRGDSSRFKKYVDIAPLITAQNTKSICGKANWRYPTKAELYSLLPLNNEVFEFNEATGGSYGYYITSDPAPYGRFKGLNMTTMAETDVSTASYSSAYLYRLVAD